MPDGRVVAGLSLSTSVVRLLKRANMVDVSTNWLPARRLCQANMTIQAPHIAINKIVHDTVTYRLVVSEATHAGMEVSDSPEQSVVMLVGETNTRVQAQVVLVAVKRRNCTMIGVIE
jgi:hypothetical protein